jgi:hypothetical protein
MTYQPVFQPQLGRGPTSGEDCGVRSTQMALDWATEGLIAPSPKYLRPRMGALEGGTNPLLWKKAIDSFDTPKELGNEWEPINSRVLTGGDNWDAVMEHLRAGKSAVVAVNYGVYYMKMPKRSGSSTFKGAHAIFFLGYKKNSAGVEYIKAWDPLCDGRRPGIPKGPIWVPAVNVGLAADKVLPNPGIYALLVEQAQHIGSGFTPPEPPEQSPTFASVLADLIELRDTLDQPEYVDGVQSIIDDVEALIGPYRGMATEDEEPAQGVN